MSEQEKLIGEIKSLSDSIRKKNRALRLGISERDKYLETTFKPIITPLKEVVENVKKSTPAPTLEDELLLPISKVETEELEDSDGEESEELTEESDILETSREKEDESPATKSGEEEEEIEDLTQNPSDISRLGTDILSIGALGRKYVLKMLHGAPANKRYHVYGARLEGSGLKIGNSPLEVDKDNNIIINNKKFKGTTGLFELIFKSKPDRFTRSDLMHFKRICKLTNVHKRSYSQNSPVHRNTSVKYKSIISQLFPPIKAQVKRKSLSEAEINLLHKRRKTTGKGILKDSYKTNVIYYNDVNKLVARMRLIHEAMQAGHTGLQNEWVALMEELKNRGIIE